MTVSGDTDLLADEAYPEAPPLLPRDMVAKARVRSISLFIASEIGPLQNTGLDSYFKQAVGPPDPLHLCRGISCMLPSGPVHENGVWNRQILDFAG